MPLRWRAEDEGLGRAHRGQGWLWGRGRLAVARRSGQCGDGGLTRPGLESSPGPAAGVVVELPVDKLGELWMHRVGGNLD